MELKFSKYQGTGNDFVIVDAIAETKLNLELLSHSVAKMCDRRFGIGADGLIIIKQHKDYDFEMIYYNSDGKLSSMCGNGGRCIVHFAYSKSYIQERCRFLAVDGEHIAVASNTEVDLKMSDVSTVSKDGSAYVLDTGSPHYVFKSEIPKDEDFIHEARQIRYGEKYGAKGINVNCIELNEEGDLYVLTYERGVEDITYSCGTGVVAATIAHAIESGDEKDFQSSIITKGGRLSVRGKKSIRGFEELWLRGPARLVFEGTVTLQSAHLDFPKLH